MTYGRLALTPLALALVSVALTGCPDSEGEYNSFVDRTEDKRGGDGDGDGDGGACADCDLTGVHLVAIDTVVLPGTPLQFIADFEQDLDANTLSATFTPLSLELNSTTTPREELPMNPIVVNDVPINDDGSVEIDFGTVMVEASANPITGSPITASVIIDVRALSSDAWCGTAGGDVMSPIQQNLEGSTVAGVRLVDRNERPDDFPCVGENADRMCFTKCSTLMGYIDVE